MNPPKGSESGPLYSRSQHPGKKNERSAAKIGGGSCRAGARKTGSAQRERGRVARVLLLEMLSSIAAAPGQKVMSEGKGPNTSNRPLKRSEGGIC